MKVVEVLKQIEGSQCMTSYKCYDGSIRIDIFDFCGFDENGNDLIPEEYDEREVDTFLSFLKAHCETCDNALMYPHYTFEDGIISVERESYNLYEVIQW